MISSDSFINELLKHGIHSYTGVPCSFFTPLVNELSLNSKVDYLPATSEGEAISIASGYHISDKISVVMVQNSGLGNMVNPITSLSLPFKIPSLLLISWRGEPGYKDEPQHEVMGKITCELLDLMGIPSEILSDDSTSVKKQLEKAVATMNRESKPYALIVKKGTFSGPQLSFRPEDAQLPSRYEALTVISKEVGLDAPIIATTGKTGRELYTIRDSDNHLYCVGAMGFASAFAYGIAKKYTKPTYIIDGDGAALMHLGNFATIGRDKTLSFVHLILDNGAYDSTGGQLTISDSVDFCQIATACGYKNAYMASNLSTFTEYLRKPVDGSVLLYLKIRKGSLSPLSRPSSTPDSVKYRLIKQLSRKIEA